MIFTGISTDAADFLAFADQHEQWRQPFDLDEGKIRRDRAVDVDPAQGRALAFRSFLVDRRDFTVKSLAPPAPGLFEHDKFRCRCACLRRSKKHRAEKRAMRRKFP